MVVYSTYMEDYAGKNQYPIFFAIFIATLLIASTFFGRVYYGVHSFVDTCAGLVLAILFSIVYIPFVMQPISYPSDRLGTGWTPSSTCSRQRTRQA